MSELHSPLSERDLELLSAYLDGELAGPDKGALEARLAREESLRVALHDLRANRQLLRSLPLLRAPRSFALDPAVYGRRVAWWRRALAFENAFQLAGALGAAASLVLVVVGLLLVSTSQDREAAPLAPSASPMLEIALQPTGETLAVGTPAASPSPQALRTATHPAPAAAPVGTATPPASLPPAIEFEAAAEYAAPDMDEGAAMLGMEAPAGAAAPPPAPQADTFAPGIMAAAPESAPGEAAEESQLRDGAQEPLPSPAQQKLEVEPTPTGGPTQTSEATDNALPASATEAESLSAASQAEERAAPSGDDQTGTALTLVGLAALLASVVLYLTGRRRARRL
ncbi:MAG: hypothetical protein KBH93_05265 [Anaerolineae bacterium]|nr:hypothetical protein [Anaerolineae bacterium]